MTKHLRYLFAVLLVWVCTVGGYAAIGDTYKLVTSTSDLKAGDVLVIASKDGGAALGTTSSNSRRAAVNITITNGSLKSVSGVDEITLDGAEGAWYLLSSTGKYLTSNDNNKLTEAAKTSANSATISISGTNSDAVICFPAQSNSRQIRQNKNYGFAHYLSTTGTAVQIYKKDNSSSLTSTTTSFGDNSGKTFNFINGVLDGFTAPVATAKAGDTDLTSKLVYSSSNEDIVTVASDGTLTFTNTKFGTADIKAEIVKDDTYNTSFDTYTVINSEPAKTATSLSFGADKDGSTVALTDGLLADGSEFTGYTATESTGVAGTISYAATGDGVATVDATTGTLTINKTTYGTTTITATFTPTDAETYAASTATYTVTNAEKIDLSEIVFDVTKDKTDKKSIGKDELTKGIVTISSTSAALGGYGDYRLYSGKTTFSLSDANRVITSIKFEGGAQYKNLTTNNGTYTQSTGLWEGKEATVVFTASSVIKNITKITVTTAEKKELIDPALSFATPTQEVELKEELINVQTLTKPGDLDGKTITYVSSDNTIAEVTDDMIELKKTGEVTIKATSAATDIYSAGTAEYTLKVVDTRAEAPISVKEESVDAELYKGLYNPADNINNTNNLTLTYASSNADITLNEEGNLAYSKIGSSTITVSFAGDKSYKPFKTTFTLNVVDSRTEAPISIKEQTVTVKLPTEEYYASTNVTNGQNLTLTYAVGNEDEFDVEDDLVVFAKVGSTTITVSYAGNETYKPFTGSFTLKVEESRTEDASFKFDAESYEFDLADEANADATFDASAKLQNPNSLTYAWTLTPETNGVSIDTNGKVTGLKRGTYTITATSETNKSYLATTATCQLVVENSAVEDQPVKFIAGTDKGEKGSAAPDQMQKSFVSIVSGRAAFNYKDNEYRFYKTYGSQKGETTISTKIGNIIKIEFVGKSASNSLTNLSTEDNQYSTTSDYNGVWKGSAKSVTFTAKNTTVATKIIVTLELPVAKSYTLDETTTNNVIENYENANVTLKRTLSASYWNTFCVPFALDADEVTNYFGEGTQLRTYEGNCEGNIVNFTTVTTIEAGKPYLMKPGTDVVTDPEFKNVIMVADNLDENGNPQAVGAETSVQMKGIYNHVTLEQSETNLFLGDGDKFYYPADAEACAMDGLRAYFIVPEGTDIKKLRTNLDGTTSLDAIFGSEETGAAVYNLQGVYVGNSLKQLKSGVYIQNGKKIVVK